MLVSIIVPAYKQGKRIAKDIRNIHKSMKQTRWDFEIIVVNDGSPDNTYSEAKKVKRKNVKVLTYKKNYGKGYAIRYGMARARGDLIAFIDAGMDINPNGISMMLEHMIWYDSDIIVGSKRHSASKVEYTGMRKLYSYGYYFMLRLMFGLRVRDTQAGLKIFKREVLERVLPRLLIKRYAFDIEILSVAHHLGFTKIHEGPVELELGFKDTSFSKTLPLIFDREIRNIIHDTFAVFYRLKILRYYDDGNKRKWRYDKELDMRINTGL